MAMLFPPVSHGNTITCPRCGGTGYSMDGHLYITDTGIDYKAPSKCYFCRGKRLVLVIPIPDEKDNDN